MWWCAHGVFVMSLVCLCGVCGVRGLCLDVCLSCVLGCCLGCLHTVSVLCWAAFGECVCVVLGVCMRCCGVFVACVWVLCVRSVFGVCLWYVWGMFGDVFGRCSMCVCCVFRGVVCVSPAYVCRVCLVCLVCLVYVWSIFGMCVWCGVFGCVFGVCLGYVWGVYVMCVGCV